MLLYCCCCCFFYHLHRVCFLCSIFITMVSQPSGPLFTWLHPLYFSLFFLHHVLLFFLAIVNDECWLFVTPLSPPPGLGWRVSSGDTEGLTWQNLISGAVVSALNHPISSSNSLACDGQTLCLGWGVGGCSKCLGQFGAVSPLYYIWRTTCSL